MRNQSNPSFSTLTHNSYMVNNIRVDLCQIRPIRVMKNLLFQDRRPALLQVRFWHTQPYSPCGGSWPSSLSFFAVLGIKNGTMGIKRYQFEPRHFSGSCQYQLWARPVITRQFASRHPRCDVFRVKNAVDRSSAPLFFE